MLLWIIDIIGNLWKYSVLRLENIEKTDNRAGRAINVKYKKRIEETDLLNDDKTLNNKLM